MQRSGNLKNKNRYGTVGCGITVPYVKVDFCITKKMLPALLFLSKLYATISFDYEELTEYMICMQSIQYRLSPVGCSDISK
jgi:hypothetical protein